MLCMLFLYRLKSTRCWMFPENSSSAQDYTGSPDVITASSYALPQGPWELDRVLAQTPGNKQRGYYEKKTVSFNLIRLFPLGSSCCLHCNFKVDTQHPQPPLRWDIIAWLLLRLLPCHAVWRSQELCLESVSSGKPPHTGVAWRTPTKHVSLCSLLVEKLFQL